MATRQAPRSKKSYLREIDESYLCEISATPLLSGTEQMELGRKVQEGNPEARDRMVRAYLQLVVKIARWYTGRGLGLQDLIAEGNWGLVRAVEHFDPARGKRFEIYARYWIKQAMTRAIRNTANTIRMPAYMGELLASWSQITAKLENELGRAPTQEEVAKPLNLTKKQFLLIKKAIRVLNTTTKSGFDRVVDGHSKSPDMEMVEEEERRRALRLLDKLDKREATVLRMRFGLDDEEPKTRQAIGECFGLTHERIRQIENEALKKLNERLSGSQRVSNEGAGIRGSVAACRS